MSKVLSLKLRDDVFAEAESVRKRQRRPRNAYLNDAVAFYNRMWKMRRMRDALVAESQAVRADSLAVLAEFEAFEDELDA